MAQSQVKYNHTDSTDTVKKGQNKLENDVINGNIGDKLDWKHNLFSKGNQLTHTHSQVLRRVVAEAVTLILQHHISAVYVE